MSGKSLIWSGKVQGNHLKPTGCFFPCGALVPLIHDASLEEKSGLATDGCDGTAEVCIPRAAQKGSKGA